MATTALKAMEEEEAMELAAKARLEDDDEGNWKYIEVMAVAHDGDAIGYLCQGCDEEG